MQYGAMKDYAARRVGPRPCRSRKLVPGCRSAGPELSGGQHLCSQLQSDWQPKVRLEVGLDGQANRDDDCLERRGDSECPLHITALKNSFLI
jgi:hypothetical protein